MKNRGTFMDNALTNRDKWRDVWAGVKLPAVAKPKRDIIRQLEKYLPHGKKYSMIEIGCAPGGWLAYFNNNFGYKVAGVEYVETAAAITNKNMNMLAINANVLVQDFFALDCVNNKYDIVFSAGFIEHFSDLSPVMEKICMLSQKYVVTIVPNVFGINGFISKKLRPKVYAEHKPIDLNMLNIIHTRYGLKTLFCNYVGGAQLIVLASRNNLFFNKHRYITHALNIPIHIFNLLSQAIQKISGYTPRSKIVSQSLMYIGIKNKS